MSGDFDGYNGVARVNTRLGHVTMVLLARARLVAMETFDIVTNLTNLRKLLWDGSSVPK